MKNKTMKNSARMKGTPASNSLSSVKIEQLSRMPIIENTIAKSEDGKWIIHRTTITDIKPVTYFEKVLAGGS